MDESVIDSPTAAPAAPSAPAPAPTPAPGQILSSDAGKPADPWSTLPAKFVARGADGQLDRDASIARLLKSHGELESRFGRAGGSVAVPETAEGYAVKVPESLTGAFDPATDAGFKEFAQQAHAAGFSDAQMQLVVDAYGKIAPQLVGGAVALDGDAAEAALRQTWKTDQDFAANMSLAERAVRELGEGLGEPLMRAVRDNVPVIQLLARVGAQLGEDTPPAGMAGKAGMSAEQLMAHPAYSDAKHPEHGGITARVRAAFAARPGADDEIL